MSKDYFKYVNNFKKYEDVKSDLILGDKNRENSKYTIAIPTYKRPKLLKKALISAINQINVDNYEIIVVDNEQNNNTTKEVIKENFKSNIFYFRNKENIGMFGNWNRCIELAQGEYITILNDDDWLSSNYLAECNKYLDDDIDGLIFKNNTVDLRDTNKKKVKYKYIKKILDVFSLQRHKLTLFDFFLGNKSAGTLGVLMKTRLLQKLGGYNPDFFPSSDYVFHANYCYNYQVFFINEKLNYYRILKNESAKQETLEKWKFIDNDIRHYLINKININYKFLNFINKILQKNRINGMVNLWNYQNHSKKYSFLEKIFNKILSLKLHLNI